MTGDSGGLSRRGFMGAAAAVAAPPARRKLSIFSKHLQWLGWEEMAALAAEIGFDGVDLTVRGGGHVLPERVEDDLPKVAAIVRRAGLELPMITAGIVDTSSPHAEAIVRTASKLGIRYYRWGGFRYREDKSIPAQIEELKARVRELEAMNKQYGVCAMYHTHSGLGQVGASIWDLYLLLKDFDARYVGVNYDTGHATVEGGFGGWINTAHLTAPMMRGVAIKDFLWVRNPQGEWRPRWCPLGEGMVNLPKMLGIIKANGFDGPVQIHYEYPLGGADTGKAKMTISRQEFVAAVSKDLKFARGLL